MNHIIRTLNRVNCWLLQYNLISSYLTCFVCEFGNLFQKVNNNSRNLFPYLYLPEPYVEPNEINYTHMHLAITLSFIKFWDPWVICLVYFSDSVLVHNCLFISQKKCSKPRLIISIHLKKERKDGMPKKHDPQWGKEKRWRTKEIWHKKEKRWRTKEVRPKKWRENQSRRRAVIHLVHRSDQ